jgi:uncharacterized protein (DUF1800 family)
VKRLALVPLTGFAIFTAGCSQVVGTGGGGGGPLPFSLSVSPKTLTLNGTVTQQFTVKTSDGTSPALVWTVNGVVNGGALTGTISSTGLYTAPEFPPATNTVTIGVALASDSTKSDSSTVTLDNPIPVLSTLAPMTIPVGTFSLTLTGLHFAPGAAVYLGTTAISTTRTSSTLLTATGTAVMAQIGDVTITVRNPTPGSNVSSGIVAKITGPNPAITVTVAPKTATLTAGSPQVFSAVVTGTTNTAVTWQVNGVNGGNDTVGTIDNTGNYYAPDNLPIPSSVTVTAVSVADPTKSDNATIAVQNPVPVLTSVTPGTLSMGGFQITLNGTGFVNTSTVSFGGQSLAVTYLSPLMLTAVGSASLAQLPSVIVTVTNPSPIGGTSNGITVKLTNVNAAVPAPIAVRFLEQSSFGPNTESLNQFQQLGIDGYLQNQFSAPPSPLRDPRPKTSTYNLRVPYVLVAIGGGDQLRQRVALALNELWVVAGDKINDPVGYTNYLRALSQDSLGNYYNVMKDVTLTPAMGHYLDMVDNDNPGPGQHANENYAREIMQLFCLGLNKLNPDGTPVLDTSGNVIPTYTQNDVMSLGLAFTGWTYPVTPGKSSQTHNPEYYGGPMVAVDSNHSTVAKTLLGQSLPAGQTAAADLDAALTVIFNHPNIGPFVARRLIQSLVSSNPSPAYVQRVTQAFNSGKSGIYGSGQRGDLQATVAAVLLDSEARQGDSTLTVFPTDGKLREPLVTVVSFARAFHAKTDGQGFTDEADQMSQSLFFPPTVFNFFPPLYQIPGSTLNGPEFGIYDTVTSLARMNFVNDAVYGTISSNTQFDFSPVITAGTSDQMVAWLDTMFLHGTMPSQMKQNILTAVNSVNSADTQGQAQAAIYLVVSSSMYQVQH